MQINNPEIKIIIWPFSAIVKNHPVKTKTKVFCVVHSGYIVEKMESIYVFGLLLTVTTEIVIEDNLKLK